MAEINAAEFGMSEANNGEQNRGALQAALDTGENIYIPRGAYTLTGEVEFRAEGQELRGDGRAATTLMIPAGGNGHALIDGVLDTDGNKFVGMRNLRIDFEQRHLADSRTQLNNYKPGIFIDAPRAVIDDVIISKATTGVKAVGNFGGLSIRDTEASAFSYGFDLGHTDLTSHALDTVFMANVRTWPHGLGAQLQDVVNDGQTVGFAFGNIDDFKGHSLQPYRARLIVSGDAFDGQFSSLSMECGKFEISGDARLQVSGLYISARPRLPDFRTQSELISVTGAADLIVSNYRINTYGQESSLVRIDNPDAEVIFSGGFVTQPQPTGQAFLVDHGDLGIYNTRFEWRDTWSRKDAYFVAARNDSILSMSGNKFDAKPDGIVGPGKAVGANIPLQNLFIGSNQTSGWGIAVAPNVASHARAVVGFDGNDFLAGSSHNDRLVGLSGSDYMLGHKGDDVLSGGVGNDVMQGGDGNDTIFGDAGNDAVFGGPGNDHVIAGDGADTVSAGIGNNIADGGPGDDLLRGLGTDKLLGNIGNDRIFGGEGSDTIDGGAGFDRLYGGGGSDTIYGGLGADLVFGGNAADHLFGGAGFAGDTLNGGDGIDWLLGGAGTDVCYGGRMNDALYGGGGKDLLLGGADDDRLYGGNGDDTLSGGRGDDVLAGGYGADVFFVDFGQDVFFIQLDHDRIDVSHVYHGSSRQIMNYVKQQGRNVVLEFGGNFTILKNCSIGDLEVTDFIF